MLVVWTSCMVVMTLAMLPSYVYSAKTKAPGRVIGVLKLCRKLIA